MQQILQRRSSVSCTTRKLAGTGRKERATDARFFVRTAPPRFAGCLPPEVASCAPTRVGIHKPWCSRSGSSVHETCKDFSRCLFKTNFFRPSRISFAAKQQSFIRKRPSVASGVAEEACLMRVRWLRPESAAATKVPPEPTNGSSTTPAGRNDSTNGRRMLTAFSCRALHRRRA